MFLGRRIILPALATLLIAACSAQTPPATLLPTLPVYEQAPPPGRPGLSPTRLPQRLQPLVAPSLAAPREPPSPLPAVFPDLDQIAFDYVQKLVQDFGARESSTIQELRAAEYLVSEFAALGYSAEIQPFPVDLISSETSSLTLGPAVDDRTPEPIRVIPLRGTSLGVERGPLVHVGLARAEDVATDSLTGQVALIERGIITFREKVDRVSRAGAVAAVIYNNLPGIFQGVSGGTSIPAVSISSENGARLLDLLAGQEVRATLSVEQETLPSRNVVATKSGAGDNVVVLGGHYDTVADIAGANDNASGTAVLLTLARQLVEKDFPFELRFIAFGSEELGLLGSNVTGTVAPAATRTSSARAGAPLPGFEDTEEENG